MHLFSEDSFTNFVIVEFFLLMSFVFTVVITLLAYLFTKFADWSKEAERQAHQERIEEIRSELSVYGTLFRCSMDSHVFGICTERAFQEALAEYNAENGTNTNPTSKVSLDVPGTFTFALDEEYLRPAHTGTKDELVEQILYPIIRQFTGDSLEGLNPKELESIYRIIARMDRRLFVPFASASKKDDEIFGRVGRTNITVAKAVLMK